MRGGEGRVTAQGCEVKGARVFDLRGVSCLNFEDWIGVETGFGGVDAAGHINGDIRVANIERKLLM